MHIRNHASESRRETSRDRCGVKHTPEIYRAHEFNRACDAFLISRGMRVGMGRIEIQTPKSGS